MSKSDDVRLIWDGGYCKKAYNQSKSFLINNSSQLVAYSNGIGRGSKSTINKAKRDGIDVINFYNM